jgi:hypothetical protein
MNLKPDFDQLIKDARASRRPVPISQARRLLGALFEEHLIDQETLVFPRHGQIALTAKSWMHALLRAKEKAQRAL